MGPTGELSPSSTFGAVSDSESRISLEYFNFPLRSPSLCPGLAGWCLGGREPFSPEGMGDLLEFSRIQDPRGVRSQPAPCEIDQIFLMSFKECQGFYLFIYCRKFHFQWSVYKRLLASVETFLAVFSRDRCMFF